MVFATFNQWKEMGEQEGLELSVKKGERSTPIFVPIFKKDEEHLDAEGNPRQVLVSTKLAFAFHVSQIQNGVAFFQNKYGAIPAPAWDVETVLPVLKEHIEKIVPLHTTISDQAYYLPGKHEIYLPELGQFPNEAQFYATLLHEATHATEKMDDAFQESIRKNKLTRDEAYAYCELRAELGSLLLAQTLGLPMETGNAASYMEGWGLRKFADDHEKMILMAANYAQKAVDIIGTDELLLALQEARNHAIQVSVPRTEPKAVRNDVAISITPADLKAGKRYTFTEDPGHGWLVVPVKDVQALGIADQITPYSYLSPKGGKVYLEEDHDAGIFVRAYAEHFGLEEDALWKQIAVTNSIDRAATCRNYDSFSPEKIASPEIQPALPMRLSV